MAIDIQLFNMIKRLFKGLIMTEFIFTFVNIKSKINCNARNQKV
jgi:hypothetical protein